MSTVRPCPGWAIDARQPAPYRRAYDSLRPSPVAVSTMRSAPRACLSPRVRRWAGDRSPGRTLLELSGPTAGVRPLPAARGGVTAQERASAWVKGAFIPIGGLTSGFPIKARWGEGPWGSVWPDNVHETGVSPDG